MHDFLVPAIMALGFVAGGAGALLGVGGGIFLVPILVAGFHLPFPLARGISLMTVIATSSAVAAGSAGRQTMNVKLAMLLQITAAAGGLAGGLTSRLVSDRVLTLGFGAVMLTIAAVMLSRLERRNIILDPAADAGPFGGSFHDVDTGQQVVYRLRRLPVALAVAFVGGNVSSLLGLGGGIFTVPGLNSWCGVPMRAAAATSALMIGVTAASAVPIYYARGDIDPHLAAAAVIGVLAGSQLGLRFGVLLRARVLKILMIGVLLGVSVLMFTRGLR